LNGWKPLDKDRPFGRGAVETIQGIAAKGIDARPVEEVRVAAHFMGDEFVRDKELGPAGIRFSVIADHSVHGKDHRL
jgi:hypothetical protein